MLIVGSGPSGAQAAKQAIERGLRVAMLDAGVDEPALEDAIPSAPFSELRRNDPGQRAYFVGDTFGSETDRNDRLGSHFTAPRAYITKHVADLLPVRSDTFFPVQSLAMGGLGVGWGAGCQTYEPFELERAGMPAGEMQAYYDAVVRDIGVSGAAEDDTAPNVMATTYMQPPSDIDTNARSIMDIYRHRRAELLADGFKLGRDPLALLTQPIDRDGIRRSPNPYSDMDFYANTGKSIYRPKYTIAELRTNPNFRYIGGAFVTRFDERDDAVAVTYTSLEGGPIAKISAKKLLLAAGAINSARIALRSTGNFDVAQPLLANQMHYMPCINLRMLGRPADDRRHSMGQLLAVYTPRHRAPDHVILGTISYRSLLHFRIVRQMPVPTALGVLLSRALMTSLTMVGVHHPEVPSPEKWLGLSRTGSGDELVAGYRVSPDEKRLIAADMRGVVRCLWKLRCIPMSIFSTNPGSSIHYAGTVPADPAHRGLTSGPNGKLSGSRHVFFADSSPWTYLPAKGLTFTLMANGRRVADVAASEIEAAP